MSGKRIVNAYKTVNKDQAYALKEAVKIVKENATAKFDETIDVAINLGVDPKLSEQKIWLIPLWQAKSISTAASLPRI